MKKCYKIAIIVGCSILFLTMIVVFLFRFGSDRKQTKKQADQVIKEYDVFQDKMATFLATRDLVYTKIFQNPYYDTLEANKEDFDKTFSTYEESVLEVEKVSKNLYQNCKVVYSSLDANQKCDAFSLLYERTFNFFKEDLMEYQELWTQYNEWAKSQGKEEKKIYQEQRKYDYVDYDGDKFYSGKRES